jgi:hypothetical protein
MVVIRLGALRQGMGCTMGWIRAAVCCCLPLQLLQRRAHQPQVLLSLVVQLPGNVGLFGGCFEPPTPPVSCNNRQMQASFQPILLENAVSAYVYAVLTNMVRMKGVPLLCPELFLVGCGSLLCCCCCCFSLHGRLLRLRSSRLEPHQMLLHVCRVHCRCTDIRGSLRSRSEDSLL